MGKRSTGVKLLDLGEEWRKLYITGMPIPQIALKTGKNMQDISRAIWLAKIPSDLKTLIRSHPETFTRGILMNTFAAKRRQCELEGFKILRLEVERLIQEGAGTQPKLKKTNKVKKGSLKNEKASSPPFINEEAAAANYELESAREAEFRINQALGYSCHVVFDKAGGGEVRILFRNKKVLNGLMETFEPFSKELF